MLNQKVETIKEIHEPLRVIHIFQSNFGRNINGRFEFNLSEPITHIIGCRVRSVTIKNFVGILNSYVYYLKSDGISNTRDTSRFNGKPDLKIFTIPTIQETLTSPIFRDNQNNDFTMYMQFDMYTIWFELYAETNTIINPPDANWSFSVEIEYLINKDQ